MIIDGRSMLAEGIGTAILLAVIVGSGFAVERLGSAPAEHLFIHAVVVGLALGVAIAVFISGREPGFRREGRVGVEVCG